MIQKFLCRLGWHDLSSRIIYDHEGGFSHFDQHCPNCKRRWEVWDDRITGAIKRVEVTCHSKTSPPSSD